jgi:hypothetical protein
MQQQILLQINKYIYAQLRMHDLLGSCGINLTGAIPIRGVHASRGDDETRWVSHDYGMSERM